MAQLTRRHVLSTLSVGAVGALALSACSSEPNGAAAGTPTPSPTPAAPSVSLTSAGTLTIDNSAWRHDAVNDVYWQLGLTYCERPAAPDLETLAVYVPGAYLVAVDNGDDTYTAVPSADGVFGSFTAATAPIVMPVDTPDYGAQQPPTSYAYGDAAAYLRAGFVYVAAGLRGHDSTGDNAAGATYVGNAPWGVTDLKAAVRFLRYNADLVPGDPTRVFVFGHSGGGAQCAVMGASGDSALYTPYLQAIGAATTDPDGARIGDAIAGVMAWCPITSLDYADAAYEWNMGQFASTGTRAPGTWTAAYSADLAAAFAGHVNGLRLTDRTGRRLTLAASGAGNHLGGSYYEHLMAVIEQSLNDFLADTRFPYTPSNITMRGMGGLSADAGSATAGAAPGGAPAGGATAPGDRPQGGMPTAFPTALPSGAGGMRGGPGAMPSGAPPGGMRQRPVAGGSAPSTAPSTAVRPAVPSAVPSGVASGGAAGGGAGGGAVGGAEPAAPGTTYRTVEAYVDHLNKDATWVRYDAPSNTARVLSLAGFVRSQKTPEKGVGAFDGVEREQTANLAFGIGTDGLHFAPVARRAIAAHQARYAGLAGWSDEVAASGYATDFATADELGRGVLARGDLYNPMYFLSRPYAGSGTAKHATHWRIRTGIMQSDTASTVEVNLALALQAVGAQVDFATVWGQGHTMAERTGDPVSNIVAWVRTSVA